MAPTNQYPQPGMVDTHSYMDRPSMKQDNHPAHNMPTPEHDGVVNKYPNKIKGMTDEEVDQNEARRPPVGSDDGGQN